MVRRWRRSTSTASKASIRERSARITSTGRTLEPVVKGLALQLAPIFVYFLIGVALRRAGLAEKSHGEFLLRLVFFVTLPLLIVLTLSTTALTVDKALLPVVNIAVNLLCLGTMLLVTKPMSLARPQLGAM